MKRFSAVVGYSDRTWAPTALVRVCYNEKVKATNCFLGFYTALSDVEFNDLIHVRSHLTNRMHYLWWKPDEG